MDNQEEKLKKVKFCLSLLQRTLEENLEPLSKKNIVKILNDIIEIIEQ